MPEISPHAIVEPGAKLAPDVRVGAFALIGAEVEIGPGCVVESGAAVVGRTRLAGGNRVLPMASIGLVGPGGDGAGGCEIAEANELREHVTIYAGEAEPTRVGDDNLLMIGSYVGASAVIGSHGIFANLTQIGPRARVEDYVRTSAFTCVDPDVTVGAYTFTAGYVQVDRDAPPYAIVQGSPFRVRGVNTHNLKRSGFGDEEVRDLKRVFRELFNGACAEPQPELLRRLRAGPAPGPHVQRLLDSLAASAARREGRRD